MWRLGWCVHGLEFYRLVRPERRPARLAGLVKAKVIGNSLRDARPGAFLRGRDRFALPSHGFRELPHLGLHHRHRLERFHGADLREHRLDEPRRASAFTMAA